MVANVIIVTLVVVIVLLISYRRNSVCPYCGGRLKITTSYENDSARCLKCGYLEYAESSNEEGTIVDYMQFPREGSTPIRVYRKAHGKPQERV